MDNLYRKAVQSVGMVAWSFNFDSLDVVVSPNFFEKTGISSRSISTLTDLTSLFDEDSRLNFQTQIKKINSSGQSSLDCFAVINTLHGTFAVHIAGSIVLSNSPHRQLIGIIRFNVENPIDLDGQVIADTQLFATASDEHINAFSWLLDSIHAYIWYVDFFGDIKYCNRAADQARSLKLVKEKPFSEGVPFFDDPVRQQSEVMHVIHSGEPIFSSRELVTIDGFDSWCSIDKIPTVDRNGNTTGAVVVLNDLTKEINREREEVSRYSLYEVFFSATDDLIWCYEVNPPVDIGLSVRDQVEHIDKYARLIECNQSCAVFYGKKSSNDLIGSTLSESKVSGCLSKLEQFLSGGYQLLDEQVKTKDAEGQVEYWKITAQSSIKDGMLHRFWGASRNITERRRYLAKLDYQAAHDPLTGLPNRTKLHREIEKQLKALPPGKKTALLIIDLDGFREINATLGHRAGDNLLIQIGRRLKMEMDDMPGLVARLGGDEFAIFLSSIRNRQQAVVFAHRLLDAVSQAVYVDDMNTELRASIGISHSPDQASDIATLMRYAEVAMYQAKKEAVGIVTYDQERDPYSPKRLALISELGRAINGGQLVLRYQPKVDFTNAHFCGFEALLRWNHPTLGLVLPSEFIPLIETTKLIQSVTNWVLEHSIAQIKRWHEKNISATVSVNLSARNLLDEEIVSNIASLLSRYEIPPDLLELEITESAVMVDPARALSTLNELYRLGVKLSVDDFGAGYSSLYYLKQLPIQILKIDASFVVGMLESEQDRIIVSSTINLAHNLKLKVVAEGVETEAVASALKDMNCDYGQGYYFSRPLSEEAADSWAEQSLKSL